MLSLSQLSYLWDLEEHMSQGGGGGGGGFEIVLWGPSHKGVGPFFIGGADPSRCQVKIFIWQLEGNAGRERFYISCNYSCTKLKNLYIKYA